jgi:hypothetical protein
MVDEKADMAKSDHILNPISQTDQGTSSPERQETLAAEREKQCSVLPKSVLSQVLVAIFSFLSFALMGSIPNINVSSGYVNAEDLLQSNNCSESGPITGKINFNSFRFILVVGVLTWLYSSAFVVLWGTKTGLAYCLTVNNKHTQLVADKFNMISTACNFVFCILTFLSFVIGACYLSVPQKLDFQGTSVYFSVETLYMTVQGLGICPTMQSPLPRIRGSLALMFFAFNAAAISLLFSLESLLKKKQISKPETYENCL